MIKLLIKGLEQAFSRIISLNTIATISLIIIAVILYGIYAKTIKINRGDYYEQEKRIRKIKKTG